nr:hypothetical protein [Tanacetum cinerariifolium]
MDEFDKFVAKEGESLESAYERLTMLVNIMDRNNVHPIPVSINTEFLNCLNPSEANISPWMVELTYKPRIQVMEEMKPRVHDAKYFREKMLLAMKDEARSILNDEENDFMLDNSYGEETIEDLTVAVMLMDRIQPANGNAKTVPSYDAKAVSEKPNKVYDPFLKAELGYKNPERLKKAIAAQPKMYDGKRLHSAKLTIDSLDLDETLKDANEI